MMASLLSFFNATLDCIGRTKEQRAFEQKLYMNGLEREKTTIVQQINNSIASQSLATKFVLQELDVASQGDTFSQDFAKKSGFHSAQYLGALKSFEQDSQEIEKIQKIFLDFLNKITSEKIMSQTGMSILDGVMEYWEIGKYSEEGQALIHEEDSEKFLPIQEETETTSSDDSEEEVPQERVKLYTDEKVNDLMEKYSHIIEDIITGIINPKHTEEIALFEEEISLATEEGNNLASVFCAFFEPKPVFSTLPLPIINMDDKSKTFFIQILTTFEAKGFSKSLQNYLDDNHENVYALATQNDKFMQYLMAFWYVWETQDESKALQEQEFWYSQSALNGFEPAIQKMNQKEKKEVN